MKLSKYQKLITSYILYGFLFGLFFPLLAFIIDLTVHQYPFTISNIIRIHRENFLHPIIDSAPVVLAFVAYFLISTLVKEEIRLKEKIKNNWQEFTNQVFYELKECSEELIFIFDELALMLEHFDENKITKSEQKAFLYWFRNFRQDPSLGLKQCRFLLGSSISIEQHLAAMKISAVINDFERIVKSGI